MLNESNIFSKEQDNSSDFGYCASDYLLESSGKKEKVKAVMRPAANEAVKLHRKYWAAQTLVQKWHRFPT